MSVFIMVIPPLLDFGNIKFSQKTLSIMSIFTDVHWPYVCDPLGLYIFLVNDSIDPITLISLPYQLTISTYRLIG